MMTNSFDFFKQCLLLESDAIRASAEAFTALEVDRAVELILNQKGKVLVTGVGKSGNIARKMASTFSSTGTPAAFLHPTDLLHGDLGLLGEGDVCILLSHSGETDELLALLPALEARKLPRIAIVGKRDSSLARGSHVVLLACQGLELPPLHLAPTNSTTVSLAIGDALAMTAMWRRGDTAEDFARNHPSGRLGKRLTLKAIDLARRGAENPCVSPDTPFLDVLSAISKHGMGAVSVVDPAGKMLGLITDGDVRRWVQKSTPDCFTSAQAAQVMTAHPITAPAEAMAYDVLRLMEERPTPLNVMVLVDEVGRSVGLLRSHDLVRAGL